MAVSAGLAVVGLAAALYVPTAARDLIAGDTAELLTVAVTLGVAHPPGYPLFTLLGHLFSLVPLDPLPFRVHLLAVVCHALTVGLVYATGWRLTGRPLAAALGALTLATQPLFWAWSLAAEVFSLHSALVAGLLLALVIWAQAPARGRPLLAAALLGGLGLANHQTIALLAPGIGYALWRGRAAVRARPALIAGGALAVGIGLLPYLYIPWAAAQQPAMSWGEVTSPGALISLLTRADYGTGQLVAGGEYQGGAPLERLAALLRSFTPLEGLLLVAGALGAVRRQRWYLWLALLAAALPGPAFVAYANLNLAAPGAHFVLERFLLMSHVVLAPLLALGIAQIAEWIAPLAWAASARRGRGRAATAEQGVRLALWITGGIVAIAIGASAALTIGSVDQSRNHLARTFAEDVLASLDPGSIALVSGDQIILPLAYLQLVEGQRRDVTLVANPLLIFPWYVRQLSRLEPGLVLPYSSPEATAAAFGTPGRLAEAQRALFEANAARRIATVGVPLDEGLRGVYWQNPQGLAVYVEPLARATSPRELLATNERVFAAYRIPATTEVRVHTLEATYVTQYALAAYRVGSALRQLERPAEGQAWLERALRLDPTLELARRALASP